MLGHCWDKNVAEGSWEPGGTTGASSSVLLLAVTLGVAQSLAWAGPVSAHCSRRPLLSAPTSHGAHCSRRLSCRVVRGQKPHWGLGLEGPQTSEDGLRADLIFRLFKATSPRGEPQDGLYCIRNSSTKSGKVGAKEDALAVPVPSKGPGDGFIVLGPAAPPHIRPTGTCRALQCIDHFPMQLLLAISTECHSWGLFLAVTPPCLFSGTKYHLHTGENGSHPRAPPRDRKEGLGPQTLMQWGFLHSEEGGCLGQWEWQVVCQLCFCSSKGDLCNLTEPQFPHVDQTWS